MNKPCSKCEYSFEYNGKRHRSITTDACKSCEKYKKYQLYRKSKRKYESTGIAVKNIDDLLNNDWFIWHDRTRHKTFFLNQQLQVILRWISNGSIFIAKAIIKEG